MGGGTTVSAKEGPGTNYLRNIIHLAKRSMSEIENGNEGDIRASKRRLPIRLRMNRLISVRTSSIKLPYSLMS
jgi:hypothetical protein